ncbi:MAG: hypothetical protein QOJ72_1993 [Nocardioidaceae bacterium]|nr:hypothetical protein [Nocardioidaceae bacterium]
MRSLLIVAAAVLASWAACWLLLAVVAKRLPPGLARQVAEFIPSCVATARALRRHPDVPRPAKIALLVAIAWVVSPIDLIPEFIPVIGPFDDVIAVIILIRFAARRVPRELLLEAWPSDPRLLERLIGAPRGH